MRSVLVIAGPPCAGKTTLALQLAEQTGGLVVDRDAIARSLGSSRLHMHTPYITRLAEQRMRAELTKLAARRGEDLTAYVVRCLPRPAQREQLARRLGGTVRLVDPGIDECMSRAHAAGRPPGTFAAIRQWYARAAAPPTTTTAAAPVAYRPCMDCGHPTSGARCKACCERARSGRPWRTLCARVLAEESHCWVCRRWVDRDLDPRHRLSATVDHLVQLRDGGAPLDRDNVHLAHRACNTARANRLRGSRNARKGFVMVDPRSV